MTTQNTNGKRLRSRGWFDESADPAMTARYLERCMHYGIIPSEPRSWSRRVWSAGSGGRYGTRGIERDWAPNGQGPTLPQRPASGDGFAAARVCRRIGRERSVLCAGR